MSVGLETINLNDQKVDESKVEDTTADVDEDGEEEEEEETS